MSRVKRQRVDEEGTDAVTAVGNETGDTAAESPRPHKRDLGTEEHGKEPQAERQHQRSLFVRSLPTSVTTEELTSLFSDAYPVKHAVVVVDPATKVSKGYGFVTLADPSDLQDAKDEFDKREMGGKRMIVEIAKARQRQGAKRNESTNTNEGSNDKPSKAIPRVSSKLIIRNLPWTIKTADQLSDLFRSYGKIKQSSMPERAAGRSAGFGFVMMRGRKNAQKALEGINGKVVDGRTLAVDWAVEKGTWESFMAKEEQERESDGEEVNAEHNDKQQNGGVELESEQSSEDKYSGSPETEHSTMDEDDEELAMDDPDIKTQSSAHQQDDGKGTIFIRNLPFTANDDSLFAQFRGFGPVRYARVVFDHETERSRGTGFVCFYDEESAKACVKEAPKIHSLANQGNLSHERDSKPSTKHSLLEDTSMDPTGRYTMEGRLLQLSPAVNRAEAHRLTVANTSLREARDKDKRRLYLISEGSISSKSPLYAKLHPTDLKLREDSLKQRQNLIKSNPSLHLSLTRLSIRNLPRSTTSKALKSLAREAVVQYAKEVKAELASPLTKDEISRDDAKSAEHDRKLKGKGIVKQAKIVFEGREGGKVSEGSGAGRSRGYGFVEYSSHRWALMGMRWLNGHFFTPPAPDAAKDGSSTAGKGKSKKGSQNHGGDGKDGGKGAERGKRLIVEFAIENAQVVARRREREGKARDLSMGRRNFKTPAESSLSATTNTNPRAKNGDAAGQEGEEGEGSKRKGKAEAELESQRQRQRIIGRKRMARKARKGGNGK